jgi:hypothetical protein
MPRALCSALILACLSLAGTGCSVKARPAAMVPDHLQLERRHPYSVMIDTVGTEGDEIITATLVNGNDLAAALERAITESKLFSSVVRSSAADYRLQVEAKATAPAAGINMTSRVGGAWKLTHQKSGKVVFDDFVTAEATKTMGDAFVGTTRVRLAIEEAAQSFVREGLMRLGRLKLE